jgi:DMSO/TMAO reductase YedYZ molybdopterin-dependent catalytic subunit
MVDMSTHGAPPLVERHPTGDARARRPGVWPSMLFGIVAVGLTLAVGELLAAVGAWLGLLDPVASPFGALGAAFIAITPEWLKDIGISLFGQSDKAALAVSMVVTFLIVGIVIGLLGRLHVRWAIALGIVLVAVTGIAVLTRPHAGGAAVIPTLLGGAAGVLFLVNALRLEPAPPGDKPATPGSESAVARPAVDRRRFVAVTGVGALLAIAAGGLSRLVPSTADVQTNRAGVKLPPVDDTGTAPAPTPTAGTSAPTSATSRPAVSGLPPLPADIDPDVPGITAYVTDDAGFYRVDTAFTLPRVTTDAWRLKVHGLVDSPFEIGWSDLLAMPQVERMITLCCVSNEVGGNLVGNAAWQGVRLSDLLARARPQAGADCVYSTSADGFTVTTPLDVLTDGRDALLAIGMNGAPLPIEHGFPVRMVVPGLYGYVSATKWVVDLELVTFSEVSAYWTERGWAPRGPVKTASRIDTPHYDVTVPAGVVPVAGVAWAQHRGISAVQVQVDDGPWQPARLSGAVSVDTWRQWVYRWDTSTVSKGKHTLRCRATDGTGAVQDATPRPVAPDGATGYHEVPVFVG